MSSLTPMMLNGL